MTIGKVFDRLPEWVLSQPGHFPAAAGVGWRVKGGRMMWGELMPVFSLGVPTTFSRPPDPKTKVYMLKFLGGGAAAFLMPFDPKDLLRV